VLSDRNKNLRWGHPLAHRISSDGWRSEFQDSGNELSIHIALIAGSQIGTRTGFIKQNINLKKI
jgi:hypothetical protein